MSKKIKVSVIGASGFTGKELVKLLLNHSLVEVDNIYSVNYAGMDISNLHTSLKGVISKTLLDPAKNEIPDDNRVIFLALPHTKSMEYVKKLVKKDCIIVDLSADYRFKDPRVYEEYYEVKHMDPENLKQAVYGIPEINREEIKNAKIIGNPGCYATAVSILLYPLLKEGIVESTVFIDAKSGISGAGKKLESEYLFQKRNENVTPYKVNEHRHMGEIIHFMQNIADSSWNSLVFCPHLIPSDRGILVNLYVTIKKDLNMTEIYNKYYSEEHFINICDENIYPSLLDVNYTNNCNIGIKYDKKSGVLIAISAIDNLIKGASGQAVQNMNLILGYDEKEGLI